MGGWKIYRRPYDLPDTCNCDGRPVWEPPIFDYSKWIGEEHEKKREAMLEHTGDDVARTTEIMDVETERRLLDEYSTWVLANVRSAVDPEVRKFFKGLRDEVDGDSDVVWYEWLSFDGGLYYKWREDGTYRVIYLPPWKDSEDDEESYKSSTISHNAHDASNSPSASGICESNNVIETRLDQSKIKHNAIASPQTKQNNSHG